MTLTARLQPSSPLKIPGFRYLWAGGVLSLVGTHMQFVALPFFVYQSSGSTLATALTAAAQMLPGATLGPLAGAFADARDTRRTLVAANLVLSVITLLFCLSTVSPWWLMAIIALLQAMVAQLIAPCEVILVTSLVAGDALPAANSILGANVSLARLVGPAAGGALFAVAGLPVVAVVNAASFAVAAAWASRIDHLNPPAREVSGVLRARPRFTAGWVDGWAEIRHHRTLKMLLIVAVLTGLGEGCVSALIAPYVSQVFGGSSALGILLSCQAAGGLVGALVMSTWARAERMDRVLGWAAIASGALLALMISYPLIYPHLAPALVLIAVAGVPFAAVAAARMTLLQASSTSKSRGRTFGVITAATGASQLVGILLSGYLADQTTIYLLIIDAPCYLAAGLVALRSSRTQRRRPLPELTA